MSDTIKVVLGFEEYNAIFGLAGSISGVYGTVAAAKVRDIISTEAQKYAKGEELPRSITVEFPKKTLDGFYLGLTEKVLEKEINTNNLIQIKAIASILKMKGRMEKFLDAEFAKLPVNEDEFDMDEVAEPFDVESEPVKVGE
jgi:hypothetical protein